jgi:alanine racemase
VVSLQELKRLSENIFKTSKKIRLHIKVDTGMHRQGILIGEVDEVIKIIKINKNFILEGVCSHLADADSQEKSFTESQLKNWRGVLDKFKNNFSDIKYFHTSATAGTFYNQKEFGNVVRLGIGLYGINTSPFLDLNLKPVMRVESIVSSVRNLSKGESVGYNHTYTLDRDMKVATVPMGYFEGLDRRLSGLASLKIGENFCPILGRVSMNMCSVDITDLYDINLEDKVIVVSENPNDKNSAINFAKLANTIPYDILVHIMPHLKRRIIETYEK